MSKFVRFAKYLLPSLMLMLMSVAMAWSQTTYTWIGTSGAGWNTSTNWSPTRTAPASNDILVFNTSGIVTLDFTSPQSIGQMQVTNNSFVTFAPSGAHTINVGAGIAGTDFTIDAGSTLQDSGSSAIIIAIATGNTGSVSGTYRSRTSLGGGATIHQLTSADASSLTFVSGSTCIQDTNSTGNIFGSGTANSVVFNAGSQFIQYAGSNPYQKTAPASVVQFNVGSWFRFRVPGGFPSMSGRTCANLEINAQDSTAGSGASIAQFDTLTVVSGKFNLAMTGAGNNPLIRGSIIVSSGATLQLTPASAGILTLNGFLGAVTITNNGTIITNVNETIKDSTVGGVSVTTGTDLNILGTLNLKNGSFIVGAHTLTLSNAITGTPANLNADNTSSIVITGSGSGIAIPSSVAALNNLTLGNSNGAALQGDLNINGTFTATSGALAIGAHELTLNGPISGAGAGTALTGGSTSSLNVTGSGGAFSMPSTVTELNLFILSSANGATLAHNLDVDASLTLAVGSLNDGGFTVAVLGNMSNGTSETGTGEVLFTNTPLGISKKGPARTQGVFAHTISGNGSFNNIEVNDAGGTFISNSPTVNGTLTLTSGPVADPSLSLANNASIIRNTGTLSNAPSFGTGINVTYTGSTEALSGPELPGSGHLNNLTINNSANVDLNNDANVGGTLTLTSGHLNLNANTLTLDNAISGTPANLYGGSSSSISFQGGASGMSVPSSVASLNNLTVNASSGVSLGGNLSTAGTVTVSAGQLTTGANTLDLGSTGTLSEAGSGVIVVGTVSASGDVSSKAQKKQVGNKIMGTPYSFGNIGLTLEPDASPYPGATTITRTTGVAKTGNSHSGIERSFQVNAAVNSGLNTEIRFFFDPSVAELNGNDATKLNLFSSPNGATAWTDDGFDARSSNFVLINHASTLANYYTVADSAHSIASSGSASSDIVAISSSESATISSLLNDAGPLDNTHGAQVWQVRVRDGGGAADDDALPTVMSSITFTQGAGNGVTDWSHAILAADLFDNSGAHLASGTVSATSIAFTGLSVTAADDDSTFVSLRISLKNPLGAGVADNQHFDFAVTNLNVTTAAVGSSEFGGFTTATSNSSSNQIAVVATKLAFTTEPPSSAEQRTAFSAAVSGVDANGNIDKDYSEVVTVSRLAGTGVLYSASSTAKGAISGTASWTDLKYTAAESGVTLQATNTVTAGTSTAMSFSTLQNSQSDVIGANGESTTVSSLVNDNGPLDVSHGVQVWAVTVRDGGASAPDSDALPTILTALNLTQAAGNGVSDWTQAINAADLFDGSTHLASGTILNSAIAFHGFSDTTADDGTKSLTVRISLKNPLGTGVADNQKFAFAVTATNDSAAAGMTSSQFDGSAATASSNSTKNKIDVVASKLAFLGSVPNVAPSTNFTAMVNATDANGNLDADFSAVDTIGIASGPGTISGGTTPTAVAGVASTSTLQIATNGTYTLYAASPGLTSGTSNSFVVSAALIFKVAGTVGDTADWDNTATWTIVSGSSPTGVPGATSQVILDNTFKSGSYVITVGKAHLDSCATIHIGYAGNVNTIKLLIPNVGPAQPTSALFFGDGAAGNEDFYIDVNGIVENRTARTGSGGLFYNSTLDSIKIGHGGVWYQVADQFQTYFARLNRAFDGDYGTVIYDVNPISSWDINADGYYYPSIEMRNTNGANTLGKPYYLFAGATSGTMYIRGNFTVDAGAVDSLGTADAIAIYGNIVNNGTSQFSNSPLMMGGHSSQTISGTGTLKLASGLIAVDTVKLLQNIDVAAGAVQTSGTYSYNIGAGVDSTINVNGPVMTVSSTLSLDPAGSLSEAGNPVRGTVEALRVAAMNVNQTFGSIGFQLDAIDAAADTTTVTRTTGVALTGNGHNSILRNYNVIAKNNTGLNATVVAGYDPTELNGITEANLLINKSTDAGTTWSGKSGTINSGLHQITATGNGTATAIWTASDKNAPLFVTHTITVRKYADADGDFATTADETGQKWRLNLYQDSISAGTLVNSQNPLNGVMTTSSLGAGTYIAQEADSSGIGWVTLGKVHHGVRVAGSAQLDTLVVSGGVADSTDFINTHTASIGIAKFLDTDGNPNTIESAKKWHLSLYKDSVSGGTLVNSGDTSYLYTSNLIAGTYIATEADSAGVWTRLNGNHSRYDTLTLGASEAIVDTFINFQPNFLSVANFEDHDGTFSTSGDWTVKSWHIEVHKDSAGGPLVASSDSGSLPLPGLGDGTYTAVESDSTGWIRLGIVQNGPHVAGTANSFTVTVSGGHMADIFFVSAPPTYGTKYRTFSSSTIANSVFGKKTGIEVKNKTDKYQFSSSLATTTAGTGGLHVEFGAAIDTAYAFTCTGATGKTSDDSKLEKWDFTFPTVGAGDTIVVSGFSTKKIKISKYWWTDGSSTMVGSIVKKGFVVTLDARLPMPNAANAVDAAFAANFSASGLIIGVDHSTDGLKKKYAWMHAKKYTDVMASLYSKGLLQSGAAHGFDVNLKGKAFAGAEKSLSPKTYSSVLFGDLLALKINIAASAAGVTTAGLGQLVYADTTSNMFNGYSIDSLSVLGDSLMEGSYPADTHVFVGADTLAAFDSVVAYINSAFDGPIDTVSFGSGLVMTGVSSLESASFLHSTGVPAAKNKGLAVQSVHKPVVYKLYQNFPNPFNPTTTIQFDLPEKSTVTLKVYNILGQEVTTLFDHASLNAGTQVTRFNASAYASGVYFYRIIAASTETAGRNYTKVEKMMLIK